MEVKIDLNRKNHGKQGGKFFCIEKYFVEVSNFLMIGDLEK